MDNPVDNSHKLWTTLTYVPDTGQVDNGMITKRLSSDHVSAYALTLAVGKRTEGPPGHADQPPVRS